MLLSYNTVWTSEFLYHTFNIQKFTASFNLQFSKSPHFIHNYIFHVKTV